jgi:hypothetical protein
MERHIRRHIATTLFAASLAIGVCQAKPWPASPLEGVDMDGTLLVATRPNATEPAACFLLPSDALYVAHVGDDVGKPDTLIQRIQSKGVVIAVTTPINRGEWMEVPFGWPVAAAATAEQKSRCDAAFARAKPRVPRRGPPTPAPRVLDPATGAPHGWLVLPAPTDDSQVECAQHQHDAWDVDTGSDGALEVRPARDVSGFHLTLPGGELVGVNHGEFGGALEWIGSDGAQQVVRPDANPVAATRYGEDVFVADGLDHLGSDQGRVYRLHRGDDGTWKSEIWVELGKAPVAAYRADASTWRLATTHGVTDIDLTARRQRDVHTNPRWARLYPGSLQRSGDTWFIGARYVVLRLTPSPDGYREDWLAPRACMPHA